MTTTSDTRQLIVGLNTIRAYGFTAAEVMSALNRPWPHYLPWDTERCLADVPRVGHTRMRLVERWHAALPAGQKKILKSGWRSIFDTVHYPAKCPSCGTPGWNGINLHRRSYSGCSWRAARGGLPVTPYQVMRANDPSKGLSYV